MASVRAAYDVPAYRGREILLLLDGGVYPFPVPARARIISSTGSHLYVRLLTDGRRVGPLHPCWGIDYLDGCGDRTSQPTPMDRACNKPLHQQHPELMCRVCGGAGCVYQFGRSITCHLCKGRGATDVPRDGYGAPSTGLDKR
jgi:hypothetical protein